MTTRLRNMEISSSVQRIYQDRLPDNVTAIQTAVARVRKEFANGRKLKCLEVTIGLGLSDLSQIRGRRSYRLYMDPTGAGKHRLYGCNNINQILTIHFIDEDRLQRLEEYRRSVQEEKDSRKRQKTDDRL